MLGKSHGRGRVHKMLARSGYGKGAASKAAERASSPKHHDSLAAHLASVESEVHGMAPKARMDRKPRASGGRSGIHIKPSHKGLLHKDLDVASDKPIPEKKLDKAKNSSDPAVRKRAVFAENAKHWHH